MVPTLSSLLMTRSYPGRGVMLAPFDGRRCVIYFLTGRSDKSKDRRLTVKGNSVDVLDATGVGDDPLRYYRAAHTAGSWLVVGNGDHVEPIVGALATGEHPAAAMADVVAEPDPPIYTPRIWVGLSRESGSGTSYVGHVRRRADGGAIHCLWSVHDINEGCGVLATTYVASTEDVKVSDGPVEIRHEAQAPDELLEEVWDALRSEVRIAAVLLRADEPESTPLVRHVVG